MPGVMRILLLAAAAILIAVVALSFSMGGILKGQIEKRASATLGTKVEIGLVNVSPFAGSMSVHGIKVANPEGFTTPTAFTVDEVSVKLEKGSLFSDRLIIESVNIQKPEVTSELGITGSNIVVLRRNIGRAATTPKNVSAQAKAKGEGKQVVIRTLTVKDGKINLAGDISAKVKQVTGAEVGQMATLDFPELIMKNIGEKQNGISVSDASFLVMDAVVQNMQIVDRSLLKGKLQGYENQLRMMFQ